MNSGKREEKERIFDTKKSTNEIYFFKHLHFLGEFREIREKRDHVYHRNYLPQRQLKQDKWIQQIISKGKSHQNPFLLFSAGIMGAGKTYTLKWLQKQHLLPLFDFVVLDVDEFRVLLPEWGEYLKENKEEAGTLTQREVGYILEIALEAALSLSKNIFVDGSLRDASWHLSLIRDIQERFGNYQIGIIYVKSEFSRIQLRLQKRAEETSRFVPMEQVFDSFLRVNNSVEIISKEVDFVAIFENHDSPQLLSFCFQSVCENSGLFVEDHFMSLFSDIFSSYCIEEA